MNFHAQINIDIKIIYLLKDLNFRWMFDVSFVTKAVAS